MTDTTYGTNMVCYKLHHILNYQKTPHAPILMKKFDCVVMPLTCIILQYLSYIWQWVLIIKILEMSRYKILYFIQHSNDEEKKQAKLKTRKPNSNISPLYEIWGLFREYFGDKRSAQYCHLHWADKYNWTVHSFLLGEVDGAGTE